MGKKKKNWGKILLVSVVFLILAALVGSFFFPTRYSEFTSGFKGIASRDMAVSQDSAMYYEEEGEMDFGYAPGVPTAEVGVVVGNASPQREVIRNGSLSLVVEDVETSIEDIKAMANAELNGFVEEAYVEELTDETKMGWIRIRVPAENFDAVMSSIKDLALKVESENENADDVTKQVFDSEARFENLRAQEEQFRQILEKAEEIEDILMTTEHLNRVRWEIENLETQLRNIREEVALSTIFVNLVDEGDVEIFGIYWRPILNMKQSVRGALENIAQSIDLLVAFVVNLPLIIVWGLLLSLATWVVLKLGGKFKKWWF